MTTKSKTYLLIFILAFIWGSSFILIKRGLVVYNPFQVGALRIFVSALFMLPVLIYNFKKVPRYKWKYLIATGFLGNGIPAILFPLAETHISGALAGMINSLTPIFTLIVGLLLFGMKAGKNRLLGTALGLFGAVLMITGQTGIPGIDSGNIYALYVVLATVCYAFSVNILRFRLAEIDSVHITAFALFFAGLPMTILLFSGDFIETTKHTAGSGLAIFYIILLGLLSTTLSTVLFNKLIKLSGALVASSVTYLIPVFAVLWGMWDGESLGLYHLLGLGAILAGVYLVNRK